MPSITFDSRAITLDGARQLILSGAIHYSRHDASEWPALLRSLKEANCDTVETYVTWHLHEPSPQNYDFTGRLDLNKFLSLAQVEGLRVILRIGPYICAEQNFGGLPSWIRDIPGMTVRAWNEPWKRVCEGWIRFLWSQVKDFSASQGGPIILVQVENEFGNISETYGADGDRYIAWCGQLGESLKCGVPLIMCLGGTPGVLETINAWRPHEHLAAHWKNHPELPALCTEHWSGWYNLWGFPRRLRPADEFSYAALRFFAGGATGINYYMWAGGNNRGREGMYLQVPSYDFDAPINHWGQKTRKVHHLAAMHAALRQVQAVLLQSPRPELPADENLTPIFSYGQGTEEVTFLCNDQKDQSLSLTHHGIPYTVPPLSVKLFQAGQLLFDTHALPPEQSAPQFHLIEPTSLAWHCSAQAEPMPYERTAPFNNSVQVSTPEQQLPHTLDQTDYCWYETELTISPVEAGKGTLVLTRAADFVQVFVNGRSQAFGPLPLVEERGDPDSYAFSVTLPLHLSAGAHRISILCSALGLIKGDWMLDKRNMIHEKKGLWGPVTWKGQKLSGPWHILPGLLGEALNVPNGTPPPGGWIPAPKSHNSHHSPPAGLRWWRTTFTFPKESGPYAIDLQGLSKGFIWLNGQPLCRYWLLDASTTKTPEIFLNWIVEDKDPGPTQRYYRLPLDLMQKTNELIILDELRGSVLDN